MSDPKADEARRRRRTDQIQRQLDEALAATFPASDPVSIVTSHHEEDWDADADTAGHRPPAPTAGQPKSKAR
jgi:hypothetical protein